MSSSVMPKSQGSQWPPRKCKHIRVFMVSVLEQGLSRSPFKVCVRVRCERPEAGVQAPESGVQAPESGVQAIYVVTASSGSFCTGQRVNIFKTAFPV